MSRSRARCAIAAAGLALAACHTVPTPEPSAAVLDRVTACGAGLVSSDDVTLNAGITSEIMLTGRLSLGRREAVRAAIFERVSERDAPIIYEQYLTCVTSEREMNAFSEALESRRLVFARDLERLPIGAADKAELLSLADREIDHIKGRRLLEARASRKEVIIKLFTIAKASNLTIEQISILSGVFGPTRRSVTTRISPEVIAVCAAFAPGDPLCEDETRSMLSRETGSHFNW